MQKTIPATNPELLAVANDMSIAANAHQANVPLLHNTKPDIDADIQALVEAIMAQVQARSELRQRRETTRDLLLSSRALLMFGRDSFKMELGTEFNERWTFLGHTGSLAIAVEETEVLHFLRIYRDHLTRNPGAEIVSKNFTATHLATLGAQLTAARGAVNLQETVVGSLMADRDNKARKLRKRVRDVINELSMRLDPLDERWLAFGLNKPGAEQTPEVPTNIIAVPVGPTATGLQWGAARRAAYYRVWQKVVGVDSEPTAIGSPVDLDFTLEDLPPNTTIELYLSAVNDGGESARSAPITIVTRAT